MNMIRKNDRIDMLKLINYYSRISISIINIFDIFKKFSFFITNKFNVIIKINLSLELK